MTIAEAAAVLRAIFDGTAGAPVRYTERVVRRLARDLGPHLVIAAAKHMEHEHEKMDGPAGVAASRALQWSRSEIARMP